MAKGKSGDGALYFYVQDLIVDVGYRGRGLGAIIMKRLIEEIRNMASPGASIGLMSALEKEEFYKQLGFASRPSSKYGAGMTMIVNE
ncbi:GNAT family N-acetyltransferase [Hellea sp.]|nr:GNAT family N-acetyltransferase [Hellea sp.]